VCVCVCVCVCVGGGVGVGVVGVCVCVWGCGVRARGDRKSDVEGESGALGGRRIIKSTTHSLTETNVHTSDGILR